MPWFVSADQIWQKIDCKIYDLRLTSWHVLHRAVWNRSQTYRQCCLQELALLFETCSIATRASLIVKGINYVFTYVYVFICIYMYKYIHIGSLKIGLNEEKIHSWVCKSSVNSSTSVVMFKTEVWKKKIFSAKFWNTPLHIFDPKWSVHIGTHVQMCPSNCSQQKEVIYSNHKTQTVRVRKWDVFQLLHNWQNFVLRT